MYVLVQWVWFILIPCQNGVRLYKHDGVSLELYSFDQEQGLLRNKLEHMVRFTADVTGTKPYSTQLHQLFNNIVLYCTWLNNNGDICAPQTVLCMLAYRELSANNRHLFGLSFRLLFLLQSHPNALDDFHEIRTERIS